jgi:hypothetical protein
MLVNLIKNKSNFSDSLMTTIIVVSKWPYIEEALTSVAELKGFAIETVENLPLLFPGLVILDLQHQLFYTNVIRIGNFENADLKKPFKLSELLKLINSKLQRKVIILGDLQFDPIKKSVKNNDLEILITNKEAELLHFLLLNKNDAFSAKDLLQKIWGYDKDIKTNTLDTHLYGLRKSLEVIGIKSLIKHVGGKYKIG